MAGTQQVTPAAAVPRPREEPPLDVAREGGGRPPLVRVAAIAAGVVVFVLALVFGFRYFAYASTHETTDDATVDADEVQVTSKIGERVARIAVDTNGSVRRGQLLVALDDRDETDRVSQARAALDAQRAQARAAQENVALARDTQAAQNLQNAGTIEQARAAISSASENALSSAGQISVSAAGVDAAAAQLRAARDAVPGASENLRRARADLRRVSSLVSTGDVAAQQLDSARAAEATALSTYSQAQAQVSTALANLDQARQKLDAQRFQTSGSQAQIGVQRGQLTTARGKLQESGAPSRVLASIAQADAARAQVTSLAAALISAKANLSYTRILSPIDGFVGQKNVEVGQTVSAGTPLLTLIPSGRSYVTANFKETQVGKMRVGQHCDINVDAYKGVRFVGHVDNLSPASQNKFSLVPAQNATGNFVKVTQRLPVRVRFDGVEGGNMRDYTLRPGMSVETSCRTAA
ncbi:MAG: HlyD family secretion protein [Vulcanimicrobiaceae bacterium]